MTSDDIMRVAREAGISDVPFDFQMVSLEDLERFAAIISKHERDACYEIAQSQLDNMRLLFIREKNTRSLVVYMNRKREIRK